MTKNLIEELNFLNKYGFDSKDRLFVTAINRKYYDRYEVDFLLNETY
jgi:hypothetical protein